MACRTGGSAGPGRIIVLAGASVADRLIAGPTTTTVPMGSLTFPGGRDGAQLICACRRLRTAGLGPNFGASNPIEFNDTDGPKWVHSESLIFGTPAASGPAKGHFRPRRALWVGLRAGPGRLARPKPTVWPL